MDNSRGQIQASVDSDKSQPGFSRGFLIAVSVIIILLVMSIAVPIFLKNRNRYHGIHTSECNGNLDLIFSAKEQIAAKAGIGPGSATIPLDVDELNSYLPIFDAGVHGCPSSGEKYIVGDINAPDGTIIVPVCTSAYAGAGPTATGNHIHLRSYEQDKYGAYHRREELTFADEVEQQEKNSK
jgi:hypothetical protein